MSDPATLSQSAALSHGKVGMKLRAGEVVLTVTGRETTPFPKLDFASERKSQNTLKRVDAWLMDNAIAEADARGDEFNGRMFKSTRDRPSPADKDSAEYYLFDPAFVQPIPRPFLKTISVSNPSVWPETPESEAA